MRRARSIPLYEILGLDTAVDRRRMAGYFGYGLVPVLADEIRQTTNGNFIPGNERFAPRCRQPQENAWYPENQGGHAMAGPESGKFFQE